MEGTRGILSIVVLGGMLIGMSGCNGGNVLGPTRAGSISLSVNFIGYVSDSTPIIVEVKESRLGRPVAEAVVTRNGQSVTLENIPTGEYVVALWHDKDNDGTFDEFSERLVFYKVGQADRAVGIFGDPSEISLRPGASEQLGTITFGQD